MKGSFNALKLVPLTGEKMQAAPTKQKIGTSQGGVLFKIPGSTPVFFFIWEPLPPPLPPSNRSDHFSNVVNPLILEVTWGNYNTSK